MKRFLMPLALCLVPVAASAAGISSVYSDLNDKTCREISRDEETESVASLCKGIAGHDVYWAEGDLRTMMAYGTTPEMHCSAQQTFGRFNHVAPKIEWRLADGKPFAAIHRWQVSQGDDGAAYKSWLGVTKIENGNSCRVAIVEGSLPDANLKAREVADTLARSFNCKTDTAQVFASSPVAIDELMTGSPCVEEEAAAPPAITSQYFAFKLEDCEQTEKPDEYIFEGTWRCKGPEGYDMFFSGADARSFAGFGKDAGNNCALLKTFNGFNSFNSPVEIRFKDGQPIAAIQRWTVTVSPESPEQTATWLVVNKLANGTSCQMHFVAGAFPNANEAARLAADTKAEVFDCESGTPSYDSAEGAPDINLQSCSTLARE